MCFGFLQAVMVGASLFVSTTQADEILGKVSFVQGDLLMISASPNAKDTSTLIGKSLCNS